MSRYVAPTVGVMIDFEQLRKEDWCHTCFHASIYVERTSYRKMTGRIFKRCQTIKGTGRRQHGISSFMEKITDCGGYCKSPQWSDDDIPKRARGR